MPLKRSDELFGRKLWGKAGRDMGTDKRFILWRFSQPPLLYYRRPLGGLEGDRQHRQRFHNIRIIESLQLSRDRMPHSWVEAF